jgi:amino acid permease
MGNLNDLRAFRQVPWNLVLAIIVINISVFSFGFDQSVFSTIQAMDGMLPPWCIPVQLLSHSI